MSSYVTFTMGDFSCVPHTEKLYLMPPIYGLKVRRQTISPDEYLMGDLGGVQVVGTDTLQEPGTEARLARVVGGQ